MTLRFTKQSLSLRHTSIYPSLSFAAPRYLTPGWKTITTWDEASDYGSLAIVDTQPGATNNILPAGVLPDAVFDHHQAVGREWMKEVTFVDLRPEVGAAATLLFQHLKAARADIPTQLATALFYGIKTDTSGLSIHAAIDDEMAYRELRRKIDPVALVRVEHAQQPAVYFRELERGLRVARAHASAVIATLGAMHRPDFTADMAEQLIRLEGARAALCIGRYQDLLYLTVRTVPLDLPAWRLLHRLLKGLGQGGGHRVVAGGQIVLDGRDASAVETTVVTRFLVIMGEESTLGLKLTDE